jgi:hypothetical protein
MDILHRGPNNREATGFCRESINLVSALSHVTEKAFNGIGGASISMHHLWKGIKCQKMLFIFTEAADDAIPNVV